MYLFRILQNAGYPASIRISLHGHVWIRSWCCGKIGLENDDLEHSLPDTAFGCHHLHDFAPGPLHSKNLCHANLKSGIEFQDLEKQVKFISETEVWDSKVQGRTEVVSGPGGGGGHSLIWAIRGRAAG